MSTRRLAALAFASCAAVTASTPSPAAATLAPLSVQASFAGTGTLACLASTCAIEASSITCFVSGMGGTRVPYANGCDASLSARVPAVRSGQVALCAGVGEGTFTISDPVSGYQIPLKATVAGSPAVATFVTPALFSMSGYTYVGYGSGSVKPCTSLTERLVQFEGTFTYVRVL